MLTEAQAPYISNTCRDTVAFGIIMSSTHTIINNHTQSYAMPDIIHILYFYMCIYRYQYTLFLVHTLGCCHLQPDTVLVAPSAGYSRIPTAHSGGVRDSTLYAKKDALRCRLRGTCSNLIAFSPGWYWKMSEYCSSTSGFVNESMAQLYPVESWTNRSHILLLLVHLPVHIVLLKHPVAYLVAIPVGIR